MCSDVRSGIFVDIRRYYSFYPYETELLDMLIKHDYVEDIIESHADTGVFGMRHTSRDWWPSLPIVTIIAIIWDCHCHWHQLLCRCSCCGLCCPHTNSNALMRPWSHTWLEDISIHMPAHMSMYMPIQRCIYMSALMTAKVCVIVSSLVPHACPIQHTDIT